MANVKRTSHASRVKAIVRGAAVKGVAMGGEHLLGASNRIVPIEEGVLQNTGTVSVDKSSVTAATSYDGPYAVRQHEELDWQHDPGRAAKYLERPMHEEAETIRAIIAAQERKAIGR